MATITIAYTAPVAPVDRTVADICAMYDLKGAAADLPAFEGTYYDTNVWGRDFAADEFIKFIGDQVAAPGMVAVLRAAMKASPKAYVIENATQDQVLQYGELAPAVVDQGFTITVDDGSDDSSEG